LISVNDIARDEWQAVCGRIARKSAGDPATIVARERAVLDAG
jgi:hypothetical protein